MTVRLAKKNLLFCIYELEKSMVEFSDGVIFYKFGGLFSPFSEKFEHKSTFLRLVTFDT